MYESYCCCCCCYCRCNCIVSNICSAGQSKHIPGHRIQRSTRGAENFCSINMSRNARSLSLSLFPPSLIVIPLLSCFTSHGLAFPQLHIRIRFRRGSHNYYYYYFYYYLPLVFSRIAVNAPFNRAGGARQIATRNFHLTTLSLGTSPLS